jgi:hypothetical protein
MAYNPNDHYWIVASDETHVWSSARAALVAIADGAYVAWLAAGGRPTRIVSFADLNDVLASQAVASVAAASTVALEGLGHLTPTQMLAAKLAAGITITSTGTPALSGVYAVDPASQIKIVAIAAGIAAGKGLPGGGGTVGILDMAGTSHIFASSDFLDLAKAMEDYVYALYGTEAVLLANGSASWPTSAVTIA